MLTGNCSIYSLQISIPSLTNIIFSTITFIIFNSYHHQLSKCFSLLIILFISGRMVINFFLVFQIHTILTQYEKSEYVLTFSFVIIMSSNFQIKQIKYPKRILKNFNGFYLITIFYLLKSEFFEFFRYLIFCLLTTFSNSYANSTLWKAFNCLLFQVLNL